jgi:hypothetical protein
MNLEAAAECALRETGKPMSSREILRYGTRRGWITPRGRSPEHSVQAAIWKNRKRLGKRSPFTVIGRGIYGKYSLRSTA